MEFKKLSEFQDLINSEGAILSLVESADREEMTNERLYLKAICLNGSAFIYCKVNQYALEMFFQGRISVRDLFLLRVDEEYIVEYNDRQEKIVSDDLFIGHVINSIECANSHYYTLADSMRAKSPFDDILHIVKRDYINGLCSIWANRTSGITWLRANGFIL
jgi:hypothetical protein